MLLSTFKLGIIGCGNMSQAIIHGLYSGRLNSFLNANNSKLEVVVSDTNFSQLEKIRAFNYKNLNIAISNNDLVNTCDYILFAIKPQVFDCVAANLDLASKTVISIMAGVTIAKLSKITLAKSIARLMPNLNAKISSSLTGYTFKNLDEPSKAFILALMSSFGSHVEIAEKDFPSFTGAAGCGPAFVFMFMKAFVQDALEYGLSDAKALEFAKDIISESVINASKLTSVQDLDCLIDSVCSKGGATIEGVNYLDSVKFVGTVKEAIRRSVLKASQMEIKI